jgi:hypothetical protein
MITVSVSCTECNETVQRYPHQITMRICTNNGALSTYSFDCPQCLQEITWPASPQHVKMLLPTGVTILRWSVPAEAMEQHPDYGKINSDDMIDFHQQLEKFNGLPVELWR